MIAKMIVSAQTREEAIIKMERALGEFILEGPGIKTTIPLHLKLMQNEDFKAGNFTTAFMNDFDINK
jgi:acetyl-CoA carboxylase biotin carboxylase subunit